jgi:hypothetical protein
MTQQVFDPIASLDYKAISLKRGELERLLAVFPDIRIN